MASVREANRVMQKESVTEFCKNLGHNITFGEWNGSGTSVVSCTHCGLTAEITEREIPLKRNKVNLQMKIEGELLVRKCGEGQANA